MTADIMNLRKARKAKARREKEIAAAENRIKFGRTKVEKATVEANEKLARRRLEALRRSPDGGEKS
jgi:hypothetical protein